MLKELNFETLIPLTICPFEWYRNLLGPWTKCNAVALAYHEWNLFDS